MWLNQGACIALVAWGTLIIGAHAQNEDCATEDVVVALGTNNGMLLQASDVGWEEGNFNYAYLWQHFI